MSTRSNRPTLQLNAPILSGRDAIVHTHVRHNAQVAVLEAVALKRFEAGQLSLALASECQTISRSFQFNLTHSLLKMMFCTLSTCAHVFVSVGWFARLRTALGKCVK